MLSNITSLCFNFHSHRIIGIIIRKFSFKTVKRRNYIFHWTHIAGAFGGVAVAIIGYAVNSKIGLAPTMGAVVIGQILYGWLSDSFGFFGSPIKKVSSIDILQVLFILTGVGVLIYA